MNLHLVTIVLSVCGVVVSIMHWLQKPEGHSFWWPKLCSYLFHKVPQPLARKLKQTLMLAGYSEQQFESWFGRTSIVTCIGLFSVLLLPHPILQVGCILLLLHIWLPYLNAGRRAKKRQQEAVYALPVVMDGLAMLLATGVPLVSALQRNMSKHRSHSLQEELQVVLQDIRMGTGLAKALEGLCRRLPRAEIRLFANLLLQSSQQGNSLAPLLEEQARIRREVTTAELEQYAQEAPVRLLGPLALCIFPATIIPFVGVIVMKVSTGL